MPKILSILCTSLSDVSLFYIRLDNIVYMDDITNAMACFQDGPWLAT